MLGKFFCIHEHWKEETLWDEDKPCGVEGCQVRDHQPHGGRTGTIGRRCLKCGRFGSLQPGLFGWNRWEWRHADAR